MIKDWNSKSRKVLIFLWLKKKKTTHLVKYAHSDLLGNCKRLTISIKRENAHFQCCTCAMCSFLCWDLGEKKKRYLPHVIRVINGIAKN